ncbi:MFS transporter [Pseudomonas sp. Leaf58]|uniref:MFS transporter n=1 Tax=Pseudomonas TaxID=286 RepID=UPI0006FE6AF8|nr:MFS transporter [Pseudomonas sp. Leaf58]AYG46352.1 MFS transporter [Pseudomonas sp. Leaf58]KQN60211.1 MFS transporter [Pseudomonas sp. Leaf58]
MPSTLPRRTYLYFTAQSINLTTAVMSVTMAAIVGAALAPAATWSTVPYGFQFLFLMLATYPVSRLMSRIGRKRAFMLGSIPLAVSGVSGYLAVQYQHFPTLVFSHSALGVYIAFANFNRFAATDNLAQSLKPKALSLVVAGGVIAAVVGPALTEWLRDLGGYPLFSLCYAAFVGLAVLALLIAACLPGDGAQASQERAAKPLGTHAQPLSPVVAVAVAVAALGYGIMNLLMIQASMHMKHMHEDFSDVRLAIQWHVIAMFAPSFFTGAIIQRLGIRATICAGLGLLIVCTAMNMWSHSYAMMTLSLIALGLGWNLTYVGGGALLAQTLQNSPSAMQMQGKNDLAIAVFATLGAFSPSLLLGTVGWGGTNAICMGLCIVLLVATAGLLQRKVAGAASAS